MIQFYFKKEITNSTLWVLLIRLWPVHLLDTILTTAFSMFSPFNQTNIFLTLLLAFKSADSQDIDNNNSIDDEGGDD